jgi:preprotein translocase subunit Sec61beta
MTEEEFENLSILLETAERKHESILSNIRALDIKISIVLAFLGVLFLPAIEIYSWRVKTGFQMLKYVPGISVIIGIALCLFVFFPQKSKTIPKLSTLRKIYQEGKNPSQLKAELFSYYETASEDNNKLSKKKVITITIAYILLIISFASIVILYMLKGDINA